MLLLALPERGDPFRPSLSTDIAHHTHERRMNSMRMGDHPHKRRISGLATKGRLGQANQPGPRSLLLVNRTRAACSQPFSFFAYVKDLPPLSNSYGPVGILGGPANGWRASERFHMPSRSN
jgi:hypothetical protein